LLSEQCEFENPDLISPSEFQGAVYSIPCKDCPLQYIVETERFLSTPKKHANNIEKCLAKYSALAEHATTANHTPIGLKQIF